MPYILIFFGGNVVISIASMHIELLLCLNFFYSLVLFLGDTFLDFVSAFSICLLKIPLLPSAFFGFYSGSYNTFSGYPPEIVKKMPKRDLAEEVWKIPVDPPL